MWKLLGVLLVVVAVVEGRRNESVPEMDLVEILKYAKYATEINKTCLEHLMLYLNGITGSEGGSPEGWALQMIDSITKFPDGILIGHLNIPGNFDECVRVNHEKFQGKHCMTQFAFKPDSEKPSFLMFQYGICIPSTCSAEDLNLVFQQLPPEWGIHLKVQERDCSTDGYPPLRSEDWVTIGVILTLVVIALASTAYELMQKFKYRNESPNQLWTSFSFYNGSKQLFRISQSSSQLKCLHGIRFLSMTWVILCHAYFSFLFAPSVNRFDVGKFMRDKSFTPVSNGFVSVDSFFFLSGLLVCLVFFRDIAKKGYFDVPVAFIHRYMRLTPPFALLTLVQATIISRLGNGPFWNERADQVERGCREGWWTGMLYVQNYVKPTAMCLGQAWYLSADMQMYWVSPLILYPMLWFPAYAPAFILLLILAAALTNFTIAFVNHFNPNFIVGMINMGGFDQFKLEYVPFHTRMAPWLIGLATGYIICGMQAKKIRFNLSRVWVMVGWAACFSLLGGSIFSIVRFMGKDFTDVESALYLSFHRVGWALGLSWVVLACVGGYGGPINYILSFDFFQPLAKLSYCNFLIHMTLQSYRMNSSRINPYIRNFDAVYAYCGDLVLSNLISIPVVLLFEFPFSQLDRHFLQKLQIFPLPKPKKELKKPPEEKVEEGKIKEEEEEKVKEIEKKTEIDVGEEKIDEKNEKVNPAFCATES